MNEPITFARTSNGEFQLTCAHFVPLPRERVFAYFADAFGLEALTPPWLHFQVLTPRPIAMSAGRLIDYRLKLHGIPLRWRTRIEVWEPPLRFVDLQLRGPYRRWHPEHRFEEVAGGTLCRDVVHYAVPSGQLIEALLRPDLKRIFAYRKARMQKLLARS